MTDEEKNLPLAPAREKVAGSPSPPELVAVLDMGASAIRLVIAEIGSNRSIRTIEEASRGLLLGRDTFSTGAIRSRNTSTLRASRTALVATARTCWTP